MQTLINLNSILRVYSSNFQNLHWNSVGKDFNDAHKSISIEYYELCNKYIDITAEMLTRFDINPLNYRTVYSLVSDLGAIEIDTNKLYNREEIISLSDTMLREIISHIVTVLEDVEMTYTRNAGIKSTLEAMLEEFDIQARYINKRRIINNI